MGYCLQYNMFEQDQPQTCVSLLYGNLGGVGTECNDHLRGLDAEYGLRGDAGMINMARYVAVAPRNVATTLRYLPFAAGTNVT